MDLNTILNVGRHKNKTLDWVKDNDFSYYNWIINIEGFKNKKSGVIPKVKVEEKVTQNLIEEPTQVDSEPTSRGRYICHFHLGWVHRRNENRVCGNCLGKNAPIPLVVKRRMQKLLNNGILI